MLKGGFSTIRGPFAGGFCSKDYHIFWNIYLSIYIYIYIYMFVGGGGSL